MITKNPIPCSVSKNLPLFQIYTKELQWRFFYMFYCLVLSFCVSSFFSDVLLYGWAKPLLDLQAFGGRDFIYTDIAEGLQLTVFFSILFSFLFFLPFCTYSCWCFLAPGLYQFERVFISRYILLSFSLNIIIASIYYLYIFPCVLHFLLSFETMQSPLQIYFEARIFSYLEISFSLFFLFQIFGYILLFFFYSLEMQWVQIQSQSWNRFYAFLIIVLISAACSPPEIFIQLLMTCCLFLTCEFLFVISLLFSNYKKKLCKKAPFVNLERLRAK